MEITLEKIELVKEKTGASYKEAKAALEETNGSVVDAIIKLESVNSTVEERAFGGKGVFLIEAIRETIGKGNASKIRITNEDNDPILTVPVTVGMLGAFITPWGVIMATAAAFGFKCNIEIVKTDGTIVDISGTARDGVNTAVEKGMGAAESVKETGKKVAGKVKESPIYEKVVESEIYDKIKEKTGEVISKGKKEVEDFADDFMVENMEQTAWEKEEVVEEPKKKTAKKKGE